MAGGVAIANENEWCKAAYYDPSASGPGDGYWDYATRSDVAPNPALPNSDDPNSANYHRAYQNGHVSVVGSYTLAQSYYGTFDQVGNASELIEEPYPLDPTRRIYRGGNFATNFAEEISASYRHVWPVTSVYGDAGFRVVSLKPIGGEKLNWGPYPMKDGIVDTGDWLGVLNVINDHWVYCYKLSRYLYMPEETLSDPDGGWIYIP